MAAIQGWPLSEVPLYWLLFLQLLFRRGYLYYSDAVANTISRAGLDGSNPEVIVDSVIEAVGKSQSLNSHYNNKFNIAMIATQVLEFHRGREIKEDSLFSF